MTFSELSSREHRRLAIRHNISIELAEENPARERELAALSPRANAVADERLAKARRQLGSEVTHLVRVRQENEIRIDLLDDLLHAVGISIGCVVSQFRIRRADNFLQIVSRDLLR